MAKQQNAVTIDISQLEALGSEISSIDTKIGAATGSDAAVRKSLAEKLASDNSDTVDKIVSQLVDQLKTLEAPVLVGLTSRLDSVVKDSFQDTIDDYLNAEVEKATAGSKEDVGKLREGRKAKVEAFRALKTILETFGQDTSSVPEPKRSAGRSASGSAAAKTGKNKEGYRYSIDGKERPNSQNSISSVVYYATEGCAGTEEKPERWPTAQFKEFLAEQGVKFGETDEWEVTLPNKKKVSARRFTDEEVASFESDSKEEKKEEKEEAAA